MNKKEIYNSIPEEIECNFIINAGYKVIFKKEDVIKVLDTYSVTDPLVDNLRNLLEKILIKQLEDVSDNINHKMTLDYMDSYFEDTDILDDINEIIAEEKE